MAVGDGKFLRGKSGNNVYRKYRGKQVFGMKPYTPIAHMTPATKKAAKTFGQTSTLASFIRAGFSDVLNGFYDGTMIYRFNTELLYCLNMAKDPSTQQFTFEADSFNRLVGFEFNADSLFKNTLLVTPQVDYQEDQVEVTIPEMHLPNDLKFPAGATSCNLVIAQMFLDLNASLARTIAPQIITIDKVFASTLKPAHTFELDMEQGCACITVAVLQYFKDSAVTPMSLNSKTFNPMAIIGTHVYGGTSNADAAIWSKIRTSKNEWVGNG